MATTIQQYHQTGRTPEGDEMARRTKRLAPVDVHYQVQGAQELTGLDRRPGASDSRNRRRPHLVWSSAPKPLPPPTGEGRYRLPAAAATDFPALDGFVGINRAHLVIDRLQLCPKLMLLLENRRMGLVEYLPIAVGD